MFVQVNKAVKEVEILSHFKRQIPLRIICDASKAGLGAVLQQKEQKGWQSISFASRFLTALETKYSTDELELLAVVWALEQFRNYVYGTQFMVIANYDALTRLLKNKGTKTFTSRLTRWVDRLLPFEFELKEWSGKSTGITDYLLNYPLEVEGRAVKAESLWSNWFTVNEVKEQAANERKARRTKQPIRSKKERYDQIRAAIKPTVVTALMTSVNKINGLSNENKMMKERKRTYSVCTNVTKLRKRRNT